MVGRVPWRHRHELTLAFSQDRTSRPVQLLLNHHTCRNNALFQAKNRNSSFEQPAKKYTAINHSAAKGRDK
ncbi:MAG TPA: hypothetical protein VNZ48_04660 [Xanthobacteraceae bacterium]|jgi:hypothetical protein|nr:hypothetical protein [Xanthobacteraceae bacterium]